MRASASSLNKANTRREAALPLRPANKPVAIMPTSRYRPRRAGEPLSVALRIAKMPKFTTAFPAAKLSSTRAHGGWEWWSLECLIPKHEASTWLARGGSLRPVKSRVDSGDGITKTITATPSGCRVHGESTVVHGSPRESTGVHKESMGSPRESGNPGRYLTTHTGLS